MEMAQSLLENKNETGSEAAYAVGYVHFLQAFRKFYGRSPRDTIERWNTELTHPLVLYAIPLQVKAISFQSS